MAKKLRYKKGSNNKEVFNPASNLPKNQFPKGVSGNPKGYPKGKPNLKTLIGNVLSETLPDGRTVGQAIHEVVAMKASRGNIAAVRYLAERLEGLPTQKVEQEVTVVKMPSIKVEGVVLNFDVGK